MARVRGEPVNQFLRDLSLRYKIPLRVFVLASASALLVTISILFRVYDETKNDLLLHADSYGAGSGEHPGGPHDPRRRLARL
jgi:hypothetical protein